MSHPLDQRREFLFLYDIRMGNPNGDPDENRPRRLPDGTFYVTDVRLKRFVRDWLKTQGEAILVDQPENSAMNLTDRVQHFLASPPESVREECEKYKALWKALEEQAKKKPKKKKKQSKDSTGDSDSTPDDEPQTDTTGDEGGESSPADDSKDDPKKSEAGRQVVSIILKSFIDARLFGSSLAFKDWDVNPRPKTLTGAVQINMGEILHQAQEVDIAGTSTFSSKGKEENRTGTFTTFFGLRYGLIGFNGVANEHSAKLSGLTDDDYERFLKALWKSVSGAPTANTRSKKGQVPRLLVDVTYKPGSEFQFGCLLNYAKVLPKDKTESSIASPDDYTLDLTRLTERLSHPCVQRVRYALHPDIRHEPAALPWEPWDLDRMAAESGRA